MKFGAAIAMYLDDMTLQGRIRSPETERDYRRTLWLHGDDAMQRDPRMTTRDDVKKTLARWPYPNSQRKARSILSSFYGYLMEEGLRKDNPALQVRRPKRVPAAVYRLSHDEVVRLLAATETMREKRLIYLGVCAGLRNRELRGLQGRHFEREGFVWVSADIAKGGRERWVPVIADLEPIVAQIRETVAHDEYVLPAQRWRDPATKTLMQDKAKAPCSAQAVYYLVKRVGKRAGIAADIHPHLLRHAFADFIARYAGMRNAQALLGHADIGTTQGYLGQPSVDDLRAAVVGFSIGTGEGVAVNRPLRPVEAPTGIEPVKTSPRDSERLRAWESAVLGFAQERITFYREALCAS